MQSIRCDVFPFPFVYSNKDAASSSRVASQLCLKHHSTTVLPDVTSPSRIRQLINDLPASYAQEYYSPMIVQNAVASWELPASYAQEHCYATYRKTGEISMARFNLCPRSSGGLHFAGRPIFFLRTRRAAVPESLNVNACVRNSPHAATHQRLTPRDGRHDRD